MTRIITLIFLLITSTLQAQNALHFDGIDDYVQSTYSGISGSNDRSVELWMKPNHVLTQIVAVDWGTFSTGQRYTVNLIDGKPRMEVSGAGLTSNTSLTDGNWHHVVFTYDNSASEKHKLYIDGVLDTSFNLSVAVNTITSVDVRIGARVDGINTFNGLIDEVRIWNKALSATDISNSMNNELCSSPSLKAYYQFNNGVAGGANVGVNTVNDKSGNAHTGTLTNFGLSGSTSNWVTGKTLTAAIVKTSGPHAITGCVPYTSLGGKTWDTSGTYLDTIVASNTCDSILTVNFTSLKPSSNSTFVSACGSYSFPGGSTYTKTGIYSITITNSQGCDSVITLNLTINNTYLNSLKLGTCGPYTSPLGKTYSTSGLYNDTLTTSKGCDSVISISLTVSNYSIQYVKDTVCDFYVSPSGKQINSSGNYFDTVLSSTGCDTVYDMDLLVHQPSSIIVNDSTCTEYISKGGKTYTVKGTYYENYTSINGCDSIITLNLKFPKVDLSVTREGDTLFASQANKSFQWLNCNDNFKPITGATSAKFTPGENGNYAVLVSSSLCSDTSECFEVNGIDSPNSINQIPYKRVFEAYPNPFLNYLVINTEQNVFIEIVNVYGNIIFSTNVEQSKSLSTKNIAPGIYYIIATNARSKQVTKLMKR